MLYIINQYNGAYGWSYYIYETYTNSMDYARIGNIRDIVKACKNETMNFDIIDNKLIIKPWINEGINRNPQQKYILLNNMNNNMFDVIAVNGRTDRMSKERFMELINSNLVLNCISVGDSFKSAYTSSIKTNNKFKIEIAEKYRSFVAKIKLLGYDVMFKYTVEGENVKIIKYTGKSKKVILPNFITSIENRAFYYKNIEEISLNQGLKYIGEEAFKNNSLKSIEIPETVQFIWYAAFNGNHGLTNRGIESIKDTVKLLSRKTKILFKADRE